MSIQTTQFILKNCKWRYEASREITGSRSPNLVAVGIESAEVSCKICGSSWIAKPGHGQGMFVPTIGQIVMTCPNGEAKEEISLAQLK